MQLKTTGNLSNARMGGWLTDAVNIAKKFVPGQGGSGTVTVNVPPSEQPAWVIPAVFGAIALGAFALLRKPARR